MKAILFDMDGTLISSEDTAFLLNQKIFRDNGLELKEEDKKFFVGVPYSAFFASLKEKYDLSNNLVEKLKSEFYSQYNNLLYAPNVLPGALSLINKASQKYKLAIVSGSTREQIEIVLNAMKMRDKFTIIVGEEDYEKGKPNPEPYLKAAEFLGVRPEDCVVVEDSEPGVLAGRAAGMKVIGVKIGTNGTENLNEAHRVFETLEEVNPLFFGMM